MSKDGWVKLYRKSFESQVWQNPHLWQLWCYCLIRANHQPNWVSVTTGKGETQVYVEAGQFIFGRFSAAKKLKAKPDATYKRLLKLKSMQNVTTQNKHHYTIVTVCNWDLYQNAETEITTQIPPKYHPNTTEKNDKNVKNVKKKEYRPNSDEFRLAELLFNELIKRKSDFKKPDLQKWSLHINRMTRLDNRKPKRIAEVIRWCQSDDFWQNNILSTDKLRKQFDKLELAMQKPEKGPSNGKSRIYRKDTSYNAAATAEGCIEI